MKIMSCLNKNHVKTFKNGVNSGFQTHLKKTAKSTKIKIKYTEEIAPPPLKKKPAINDVCQNCQKIILYLQKTITTKNDVKTGCKKQRD